MEPLRPLSVVAVDDQEDAAETLAMVLVLWGFLVRVALGGAAALAAALVDPPDVALLDVRMPGMDGWELARQLREQTRVKRPLLVAVTGCGTEEDRLRSVEAGIDLHLVKPV